MVQNQVPAISERNEELKEEATNNNVYDFLSDAGDEVEIKMEPFESELHFSEMKAVNTAVFQDTIQHDYFGSHQLHTQEEQTLPNDNIE